MSERDDVRARHEPPAPREIAAVLRYGLAVVLVAIGVIATLPLGPHAFRGPVFFLAVILSAWFGGGRSGLLATLLSTLSLAYFFLPPTYDLRVDSPNRIPLLLFLLSSLFVSWLSAVTKRSLVQLQRARNELEARVQVRTADLAAANEQLRAEIADRMRVEATLREQTALLDLTHDTVFARDMNDVITYWNRGAKELYGWDKSEIVGKTSHDVLKSIFPGPLAEINRTLLETGRWEGHLIHSRRDGRQLVLASRWALQRDKDGQPVAILETNNDITEQRRAERDLRDSEARYRNIFEAAGVSIWEEDFSQVKAAIDALKAGGVNDLRGYTAAHPEFVRRAIPMVKVTDVNEATVKLFAAKNKENLLTSLDRVFLPETEEVFREELIAIAEGRTHCESETVLQTLTADRLTVLFTITFPRPPAELDRVLVTIVDITERKRAEEALQKAEAQLAHVTRVTTMGELASSIAHEVNQPLAAVTTNGNAALRWLAADPPSLDEVRACLSRIIRDGVRASEVVARIRALVKKSTPERERLDVVEVIQEALTMAHTEARRHRVAVRTDCAADTPAAWGDRVQLQQVILNLVMNGIDAMKNVTDRPRELLVRCGGGEPGTMLVSVRDSGVGLDRNSVDRIFDAFYTTKPDGLGMGLSISRSIVEAHGGRLWASANDNHGATFQLTLPTNAERKHG